MYSGSISNPVHELNILYMQLHKYSSTNANKIVLCYDTLCVIIQGGQQSGVVQSGKIKKKKGLLKVSQRKSENVRKFEKKVREVIQNEKVNER